MSNIQIIKGDITTADVDAIVNAANPVMLGGGGVDGAIHRAAGPLLLRECEKIKPVKGIRCPVGEARITPAGNLKSKYVIHTVGPIYVSDENPEKHLQASYLNSLNLALSNKCESIAFPAISCGVYGYPAEEAAEIALSVCMKDEYKCLSIYFYLFSQKMVDIWSDALKSMMIEE
ncbi:Putative O-acetyl-ADP-ribose deacetylase [Desulfamplus magnetovallimortis]|uniref:Putative O-acetyl-ADP-ribose deacetylase n=1 Tax=Desulfamplus magnetovallimortis TaxID=1246637 RepID=L0R443_9BACT|nr:O-acetyl-ADP-ribose deacetylase [Desulfamplus magnetovallimortis]CCO06654.1 Putative O-acetyl-ADP-ribose deacetylase [Desulfamplus magnetovallimortis BW-1]SLM32705.1 Putative O-acetyl-ADP-ribose deacetylase [Desulfamplus magnetovallimortis]